MYYTLRRKVMEDYKVHTEEFEIDGETFETTTFSFETVKVVENVEEKESENSS